MLPRDDLIRPHSSPPLVAGAVTFSVNEEKLKYREV